MTRFAALVFSFVAVASSTIVDARLQGQTPRPLVEAIGSISRSTDYTVFDWIGGDYDRSTLTLRGYAARPGLKERAEEIARRTGGVDEVINEIEVLPAIQSDDTVRLQAYVAIYGHPALERYLPGGGVSSLALRELRSVDLFGLDASSQFRGPHPIHIIVSGGSVQLFGTVGSTGDRQIAEAQVRTMSGVLNVVNRIEVRP